ncbi:MAG TPA: LemA family protein [Saprospiraceae bacterium]|nr:LemA family protein [Saprospiraceae bacterium]
MLYVLIFIAAVLFFGVVLYNGMIKNRVKVDNAWSDIAVFLKKRTDLIPNLVSTVKGYMQHEANTLERVIAARNQAISANPANVSEVAAAQSTLSSSLRSVFALSEAYPDLKANTNFLELKDALSSIENDLANSRRYYNATVRDYNTSIQTVPQVFLANMFDFREREFYELEDASEAKNVKVEF